MEPEGQAKQRESEAKGRLKNALVECYGRQIEDRIDIITHKITAIISAELFFGVSGDYDLSRLNALLEKIIKEG
jgi:hypothetical protein